MIADLGMLMASAVAAVYHNVNQRSSWTKSQAAQTFGRKFGKSLSVVLVVALLIVYIAIGGGIFMIWEDWNFLGIIIILANGCTICVSPAAAAGLTTSSAPPSTKKQNKLDLLSSLYICHI